MWRITYQVFAGNARPEDIARGGERRMLHLYWGERTGHRFRSGFRPREINPSEWALCGKWAEGLDHECPRFPLHAYAGAHRIQTGIPSRRVVADVDRHASAWRDGT